MGTRVSFSKQEIKRDKFTDFMGDVRSWATDNFTTLLGGIAIVVSLVVGVYFFQDYRAGQQEEARTELSQAKTLLLSGNLQVGLLEMRTVADKYSGTGIGGEALYMVASVNYLSKNYEQAEIAFSEYVSKYSDVKVTHTAAIAGVAACKEIKGEYAEAANQYLKALNYYPKGPTAEDNALGALRNYLQAGDKVNAQKTLDTITSDFWQSALPGIAQRLFAEVKPAN
ncbi:tetratricopeptide repeat protein [bacterium AH-315-J21]|nr:tetratricopeptide repeat protein [bacterium AH-315-J21]